jgi:hypothetical protein
VNPGGNLHAYDSSNGQDLHWCPEEYSNQCQDHGQELPICVAASISIAAASTTGAQFTGALQGSQG